MHHATTHPLLRHCLVCLRRPANRLSCALASAHRPVRRCKPSAPQNPAEWLPLRMGRHSRRHGRHSRAAALAAAVSHLPQRRAAALRPRSGGSRAAAQGWFRPLARATTAACASVQTRCQWRQGLPTGGWCSGAGAGRGQLGRGQLPGRTGLRPRRQLVQTCDAPVACPRCPYPCIGFMRLSLHVLVD